MNEVLSRAFKAYFRRAKTENWYHPINHPHTRVGWSSTRTANTLC